jgi:glycerol-3-phosphate acyltransferase PlsX
MTSIALDAMGGDRAPAEIVAGAVMAAADGVDVVLVGERDQLLGELDRHGAELPIVNATERIGMGEDPARALREKPNSSISVAARLVKGGEAGAFVSAGSTGAAMAAAAIVIGRTEAVHRPALASVIPTPAGAILILDCGANLEVKAEHLLQFGVMGSVAAEVFFGQTSPRIGLLNNGEEPGKGRNLERDAFKLLSESGLNFVGNVEGRDLGADKADVFVTDGFVGNIALKTTEGVAAMVATMVLDAVSSLSDEVVEQVAKAVRPIRDRLDYENTGGAHLLGVNGVVVIAHGSSGRVAMRNALRMARDGMERDLVGRVRDQLTAIERERNVRALSP